MSKPDPASTIDTSKMSDTEARAARKAERLKVWKRESSKAARTTAKTERIAAWEEATGMKWEEK